MVTWTIEAVYQNGVFRPLAPVALPENACVTLVLHGEPMPGAPVPYGFGEMDESEFAWMGWAGSLGAAEKLFPNDHDEG
jgi:hypothetical protein